MKKFFTFPSVRFFEFEDKKASKTHKKITLLLPNYVIDAFLLIHMHVVNFHH
ncbi:hypothetical protein BA765_07850 [Staphylococcus aureus]|nr:hypothetical protein TW63_06630 [Staphylococcus aureus]MDH2928955.1 hypothetical protein [Staphylococcus aureus]OFC60584.1 hypothetical protein BA765_07850 [Staphylococcus aureus]OHW18926.1 hypothetical protein BKL89_08760 [Staphylococcus aureus]OHW24121.1 hypothetical protein BKL68_09440 [Staphylococcus aureus]